MKQPLTSVVLPAYNAERFLGAALRSVLHQTYRNLQIILVNDGSNDGTRHIAETAEAHDDRVRVLSVPNGGVAHARNTGIEHASGEFIAFLDADDLWHPRKIELQIEALCAEDAAAAYTYSRLVDEEDRVFADVDPVAFTGYCFTRHMYARPVGNGSNLIVRREALLAVGGFDPSFKVRGLEGCEDFDLELKIAASYPMTAVRLYLVGYRSSPGGMSSKQLRMARAALATVEKHLHLHPEIPKNAVRLAGASVLEYAVNNLVFDHRRMLAAFYFARLLYTDFGGAIQLAADTIEDKWCRMRDARNRCAIAPPALSLFSDLSPDKNCDIPVRSIWSTHRSRLDRLAQVDAFLAGLRLPRRERAPEPCPDALPLDRLT